MPEEEIKLINPLPVAFYDIRDAQKYGVMSAIVKQFIEQKVSSATWSSEEKYLYLPDVLGSLLGLTKDEVVKAVDNLAKYGVLTITPGEHGEWYLNPQGTASLEEAYL